MITLVTNVPDILFGDTRRVRHQTASGDLIAYFQYVRYPAPDNWILCYTTAPWPGDTRWGGHMSVLRRDPDGVRVIAEKNIWATPEGVPTEITGVQAYFPPPLYCPNEINVGEIWHSRNTGIWAYANGDNNPKEPREIPGIIQPRFHHNISIHSHDGKTLFVDEEYDDAGDGSIEYKRTFKYDIERRVLVSWHDHVNQYEIYNS